MIICTQFLLRLLGPSLGKNQGTMASADFLQFVVTAAFGFFPYTPSARPPRVKATTLFPCNRHIYRMGFGQHWTLCCVAHSSVPVRPTMWFLFVGSGVCLPAFFSLLTSIFLQIPPHGEHPCLRLTLPTAERAVVFHHIMLNMPDAHIKRSCHDCGSSVLYS